MAQEPYTWQLTDEYGLPSMEVYDLFQDSKKYIWIGTDKGICKYNGQKFKYYKHPEEKGTSATLIQEDGLGRIWYKNFNGQLFYIEQDSIHLFEVPKYIKFNAYSEYLVSGEHLWVCNYNIHCYDFENKKWKDGVFIYPGKRSIDAYKEQTNFSFIEKLYSLSPNIIVMLGMSGYSISLNSLEDKDSLYCSSFIKGGFSSYKYLKDSILTLKDNDLGQNWRLGRKPNDLFANKQATLPFSNRIKKVLADDDIHFRRIDSLNEDTQNSKIEDLDWAKELFPKAKLSSILKDHEGNYWLGTLDQGVFIFSNTSAKYYTTENSALPKIEPDVISSNKKDRLFFNLEKNNVGVYHPIRGRFEKIEVLKKSPRNYDILFDEATNYLFVVGAVGLTKIDIEDNTIVKEFNTKEGKIALYNKDNLIIANRISTSTSNLTYSQTDDCRFLDTDLCRAYKYNWVWRLNTHKGEERAYNAYIRQERTNAVWTDQKYPNRFWLGCHDSLLYYQNAKPHAILDNDGKTIQALDILQTKDGVLWVGTLKEGIYGIDNHIVKWHYTTENGLASNFCNSLATDGSKLWIGGDKGISYLNPKNGAIHAYNKLDGLVTEDIKDIEYLNKKIWATTTKGLISIDTSYNPRNQIAPPIYIKNLKINGQDTILQNIVYELSYAQNNLIIEFEGLAYRSRGGYHYIYRLIGQDSAWIEQPAAAPFVRLDQLRAGTYHFEVKTVNEDGITSEKAAFLQFRIAPPFWQTWWFYSLCLLILIGVIVGIVVWQYERIRKQRNIELDRLREQEKVENEFNKLQAAVIESRMQALQSQMNPHFVFNAMTAIQNYWLQNRTSLALRYHAKFAKLMRFIFDYSNKEAITLKKELEFLKLYTTLEQMRFTYPIEVVWEVEDELLSGDWDIPPLLIQPIIENCFKHGFFHKEEAGRLVVEFKKNDVYLHCIIKDDGVGRAQVQEHQKDEKRNPNRNSGLEVTKQRLLMLHKDVIPRIKSPIVIQDLTDEKGIAIGTCVELYIPFI
ncbi:MAG: hypothetical protein GY810_00470 [Aureispira sp.]|nr:hypothetical protein [Aureispira sp.]